MSDKQKLRLGDDGEIEIVEAEEPQDWEEAKLKRSASPLQKMARSQLIPLLVIIQTLCIGALCGGAALVGLGVVNLENLRCNMFSSCPTVTRVVQEILVIPTSTITPLPPPDPAVTEAPCGADALAGSS